MSENTQIKSWLWELTPQGEDNVKHTQMSDKVTMISIPIEEIQFFVIDSPFLNPVLISNDIR